MKCSHNSVSNPPNASIFPNCSARVKDKAWLKGSAGVPAMGAIGSKQNLSIDWPSWMLREGSNGEPLCVKFDDQLGNTLGGVSNVIKGMEWYILKVRKDVGGEEGEVFPLKLR